MQCYADEEPQLGKVTKECDKNCAEIEVEWMVGTYSEPWQLWKQRKGRSYTTWKEKIPSTAVLLPVNLTNAGRLSKSVISELKLMYEKKRNDSQ